VVFGFTGRYLDAETGLQNNLNRWYDAATGQWISEDPIGFAAGDANLARYVGNEPTGYIDPSGLVIGGPGGGDVGGSGGSNGGLGGLFGQVPLDDVYRQFGPKVFIPQIHGLYLGTDNAGTQIYRDPETGRIWGVGGSAGDVKKGVVNNDGDFFPEDAIQLPDEPSTAALAADAGLGAAGKLAKGAIGVAAARRSAVRQAWAQERQLIKEGLEGTRPWTAAQRRELLNTGRVRGYQGHHINSVKSHPELAGNPNNVEFVTRPQNLQRHGGNWRNPTSGPLIDRGL
jgi:RHS repeat-associated protein